ncbi:hypothetical protein RJ639_032218 [Escallonia herrerae]|uniref:Uncharacterized protein n=1 Tax=Escallonia herrerae TaxID=1293975 RepID=A0AA88WZU6_9ASTE|nr:hypothetical protein RJ639_032218 [Escallonia herrerae]
MQLCFCFLYLIKLAVEYLSDGEVNNLGVKAALSMLKFYKTHKLEMLYNFQVALGLILQDGSMRQVHQSNETIQCRGLLTSSLGSYVDVLKQP